MPFTLPSDQPHASFAKPLSVLKTAVISKTIPANQLDTRKLLSFRPIDCAVDLEGMTKPSHYNTIFVPT